MPTHKVVPSESQETLIEALVESGRYANADAVLREGLRLVENRESIEAEKLEVLRAAARLGADAIARGEYEDFADADALVAFLDDYGDKIISGARQMGDPQGGVLREGGVDPLVVLRREM